VEAGIIGTAALLALFLLRRDRVAHGARRIERAAVASR
jgi:hypothetical protein